MLNTHSEKGRLLIVDDEEHIRTILGVTLKPLAEKIFTAPSAEEAMLVVIEENIDVVVCDIQMGGMDGLSFLEKVKAEQPEIKFLMVTAYGSMEKVITALRHGASDFLTKPFDNANVRSIVEKLIREKRARTEPVAPPMETSEISSIIGQSPSFKQCLEIALKAAGSDSNVLILGESGTGKEVFARAIHENSPRSGGPFIPVNCGAIPENLMENEFFGHVKGAFTGALDSKPGKFKLADSGTLFLDEVGEMNLPLQVKLLRVLQERKVDPVGSTESLPVDFRLVAATNKNLQEEILNENFREDLFYRLNIIPITLPPLRERGDDVILLAEYFLKKFNQHYNSNLTLTPLQKNLLQNHSWPGNIREVENVIERGVVLGDSVNGLALTLPDSKPAPGALSSAKSDSLKKARQSHEKEEIISALEKNRWNKTRTAEDLGISRRSLLYKVKEYGIQ